MVLHSKALHMATIVNVTIAKEMLLCSKSNVEMTFVQGMLP